MCESGEDTGKRETPFSLSDLSFHNIAFPKILFCLGLSFFFVNFIFGRTTQWWSTEPNTVSLAELPVFASAVDLVRMNRCRPMPLSAAVFANLFDQVSPDSLKFSKRLACNMTNPFSTMSETLAPNS